MSLVFLFLKVPAEKKLQMLITFGLSVLHGLSKDYHIFVDKQRFREF